MPEEKKNWEKLAEKELRGRARDEIVWQTPEGIEVQPVHTAEDIEGLEHIGGLSRDGRYTSWPEGRV